MRPDVDDAACSSARSVMLAARRAEHQVLLAVADLEARDVARTGGYRATRRLLEDLWHLDPARAKRLVAHAALLTPGTALSGEPLPPALPATAAVHAQGFIDDGHLRVIATTVERLARVPGLDADAFAGAEAFLADQACILAPAGLDQVARRLIATLDPDGAAPDEDPEPSDEVHLVRRRDGRLQGTILIHGRADAEMVTEVFDRLAAPAGPDDHRTLAQRRAEVLLDLTAQATSPTGIATDSAPEESSPGDAEDAEGDSDPEESADRPADDGDADDENRTESSTGPSGGPGGPGGPGGSAKPGKRAPGRPAVPVLGRALLAVTIDHHWLQKSVGHGLLDSGHALDPATARRLACDAGIVPMVLGSRSEPLDVGRLTYTVPDGMRRALHTRDGGCTFPSCTRRPRRCHAHHIHHWADHGETRLENLTLLCRYHHHLIHHDHWSVAMINGRPVYTPPTWIDPHQRPRPGGRFPLPASA